MNDDISDQQLVENLVNLLTLEKRADCHYIGSAKIGGKGRVFGGQVIAQALQAAQADISDGKIAHSLHAYFLRGGREGLPIDYHISADFDGRSFSNRRVVASQEGEAILNLTASFQTPEEGLSHIDSPMPDVPMPEDLVADYALRRAALKDLTNPLPATQLSMLTAKRAIEMRPVNALHWMTKDKTAPLSNVWFRTCAPLPDDTALHRAIIAFASDYSLLGTSALPHGLSWMRGEITGASLDHALWFHAPARADEWLLYSTDSPWSGNGRGFNRGRIFNREGQLIASAAQEGMMRRRITPS